MMGRSEGAGHKLRGLEGWGGPGGGQRGDWNQTQGSFKTT